MKLGRERFRAPEILFQPNLIGSGEVGVAEILFNTLQATDINTKVKFYKHIVLCGGSTMFPGFSSRLMREIKQQLYCEGVFKDTSKLSVSGARLRRRFLVLLLTTHSSQQPNCEFNLQKMIQFRV